VFHHLEFPGTALAEFARVLRPGGRVVIFEPGLGVLGGFAYTSAEQRCFIGQIIAKSPKIETTSESLTPLETSISCLGRQNGI